MLFEDKLSRSSHDGIRIVAGVRQALDWVRLNDPACAILDVKLPDGLSYPVANELYHRGIPYLVVSGHHEAFAREYVPLYPGQPEWLLKPFALSDLVDAVDRALGRAHGVDRS